MPLYQYQCKNCGHDLEARQKFSDDPLTTCPNCGEETLFRVIQAAGVVFKGSGFYINDSKGSKRELTSPTREKDTKSEGASSDSGGSSNGSSGSSTSTSSKTDKASA